MNYTNVDIDYLSNTDYLSGLYLPEISVLSLNNPAIHHKNFNSFAQKISSRFRFTTLESLSGYPDLIDNTKSFIGNFLNPIFHDLPQISIFKEQEFRDYREAVQKIAANSQYHRSNSIPEIFYIHSYELVFVARYIARERGKLICQYIQSSWPNLNKHINYDFWRQIIKGMLNNNFIGFQHESYRENFLKYVDFYTPEAKIESSGAIFHNNLRTYLDIKPVGIDFREWQKSAGQSRAYSAILKKELNLANHVILGCDKVCPSKGIIEKLLAFKLFLENNPHWIKRIHFVQILNHTNHPSSIYRDYYESILSLVQFINDKFQDSGWLPIKLVEKNLTAKEISAWYQISDVLFQNPFVCGGSLIAQEFISSRIDEQGVLVVSENIAKVNNLTSAALITQPNNIEQISKTLELALELDPEEKKRRINLLRYCVNSNQVHDWFRSFILSALDTFNKSAV